MFNLFYADTNTNWDDTWSGTKRTKDRIELNYRDKKNKKKTNNNKTEQLYYMDICFIRSTAEFKKKSYLLGGLKYSKL